MQQGYTTETIEQAFNPEPIPEGSKNRFSYGSLLVSVILIILGFLQMGDRGKASYYLGVGCLLWGVGSFIVKLIDITRNKQS